jgi:hypothetical protein
MTFAQQEAELSTWMEENAAVAWVEHPRPWELEHELIGRLVLPLNLDQNKRCAFHAELTAIRRAAKEKARRMDVVMSQGAPSLP